MLAACLTGGPTTHTAVLYDWDQQQQQLPNQIHMFKNGVLMNDTNGQVFVAAKDSVKLLAPISFETQINDLLGAARVSEALTLAKFVYGQSDTDLDAEERERQAVRVRAIHRRAGFAFLQERQFGEAMGMFTESGTDPREVIALFPDVELPAANLQAVLVPDHAITSVDELATTPEQRLQAREALAVYLQEARLSQALHRDSIIAADTALVQVLAFLRSPKLADILNSPNRCVVEHCATPLSQHECHHSLALL